MQITEQRLKKYIFGAIPFAALWYFFFASSFVLRIFPSLFWPALMGLAVLVAIAVKYRMTGMDSGYLLSLFGLVLVGALAGESSSGLNSSMYYAIYYIAAIFIAKAFDTALVQKQIYFFCLVHLLCIFIQVLAKDLYISAVMPLLPTYVHSDIMDQMEYNSSYYGFTVQTSMTAFYLSVGMILSCLYAKYAKNKWKQGLHVVLAMLFVLGLFFTTRRASTAMALLLMALIFWQSGADKSNRILLMLFGIAMLSVIGLDNIPGLSGMMKKTEKLISEGRFMNGRDNIWGASLLSLLERPLTGYGAGKAIVASGGSRVDNSYLAVLVERGVIGLVVFYLPYIYLWSKQKQHFAVNGRKSIEQDFAYYLQIMYILMSFVENYFGEPLYVFLYFLVVTQAQEKWN